MITPNIRQTTINSILLILFKHLKPITLVDIFDYLDFQLHDKDLRSNDTSFESAAGTEKIETEEFYKDFLNTKK